MSYTEIVLDKKNTIEFNIDKTGLDDDDIKVRFNIKTDEVTYTYEGSYKDGLATVPVFLGADLATAGDYTSYLEVISGEGYFKLLEDIVIVKSPPKVSAEVKSVEVDDDAALELLEEFQYKFELAEMSRSIKSFEREVKLTEDREFKVMGMPIEFKNVSEDGVFTGYGSIFGNVDSHNDIVQKGAFNRTINNSRNIKMLWQHDAREPIGIFTKMYEDSKGLVVEGKLALDVQRGKEAFSLMKMGAIDGLSIGYVPIQAEYNQKDETRLLTEIKLYEISIVTFPSNETATASLEKNNNNVNSINTKQKSLLDDSLGTSAEHLSVEPDYNDDEINNSLKQLLTNLKEI